jgi:predicted transport protein
MPADWQCPKCKRRFSRKNQRHACGTGDRAEVLRHRPPELVALYGALEKFVESLGPIELVTRERYVLLRSQRIFADLVVMSDALRVAIHLSKEVSNDLFVKVVADRRHVTHVAKVTTSEGLEAIKPFLRQAYRDSLV